LPLEPGQCHDSFLIDPAALALVGTMFWEERRELPAAVFVTSDPAPESRIRDPGSMGIGNVIALFAFVSDEFGGLSGFKAHGADQIADYPVSEPGDIFTLFLVHAVPPEKWFKRERF
jgi:hypothetical protein